MHPLSAITATYWFFIQSVNNFILKCPIWKYSREYFYVILRTFLHTLPLTFFFATLTLNRCFISRGCDRAASSPPLRRHGFYTEWGTRPAIHELTPATLPHKPWWAFSANVLACILWPAERAPDDLLRRWGLSRWNVSWGYTSIEKCDENRGMGHWADSRLNRASPECEAWRWGTTSWPFLPSHFVNLTSYWWYFRHQLLVQHPLLCGWERESKRSLKAAVGKLKFLRVLKMETATSHVHYQHHLGSSGVHKLVFLLQSSNRNTNYSSVPLTARGGRESILRKIRGLSPPLCCSSHDKPLLLYQDLPALVCLLQIVGLFTLYYNIF